MLSRNRSARNGDCCPAGWFVLSEIGQAITDRVVLHPSALDVDTWLSQFPCEEYVDAGLTTGNDLTMSFEDFDPTEVPMLDDEGVEEKTQPPMQALRFEKPTDLYAGLPRVRAMTQHRPREDESHLDYLVRLRGTTTPEEAVTFTAFAVVPKLAIWWAYECLRVSSEELTPANRELMELVWTWNTYPDAENRYRTMRAALYAPVRSPQVFLGMAVGWSGGGIAPNDSAPVPLHRMPQAINSAILSNLAIPSPEPRDVRLARVIDQASAMFRF